MDNAKEIAVELVEEVRGQTQTYSSHAIKPEYIVWVFQAAIEIAYAAGKVFDGYYDPKEFVAAVNKRARIIQQKDAS